MAITTLALGIGAEAELFELLGVRPIQGRLFTRDEEVEGKADVWLIGWSLWQRRYGGSEDELGKQIDMDGRRAISRTQARVGAPAVSTRSRADARAPSTSR